jgi:hypothetical protein
MRDGLGSLSGEEIFFIWEEALYLELVEAIALVPITKAVDSWSFKLGDQFLVSSVYMYLYKNFLPPTHVALNSLETVAKVVVFSWQALLGRLPTRKNLVRRGVVLDGPNVDCVLCGEGRETEDHLFASCSSTIGSLFQAFLPLFRNRKNSLKGVILIWHAVIWVLWRTRNDRIFRGIVVGPVEIFD